MSSDGRGAIHLVEQLGKHRAVEVGLLKAHTEARRRPRLR